MSLPLNCIHNEWPFKLELFSPAIRSCSRESRHLFHRRFGLCVFGMIACLSTSICLQTSGRLNWTNNLCLPEARSIRVGEWEWRWKINGRSLFFVCLFRQKRNKNNWLRHVWGPYSHKQRITLLKLHHTFDIWTLDSPRIVDDTSVCTDRWRIIGDSIVCVSDHLFANEIAHRCVFLSTIVVRRAWSVW